MKKLFLGLIILFAATPIMVFGQLEGAALKINVQFADEIQDLAIDEGRMFVFLSERPDGEPRLNTWPNPYVPTHVFATNMKGIDPNRVTRLPGSSDWIGTPQWGLDEVPHGTYYMQLLWAQNKDESRINSQGNLCSKKQKIVIGGPKTLDIEIGEMTAGRTIIENPLVRIEEFTSDTLSNWWGKPVILKASILLPSGHSLSKGPYAIRYNVAGFGGRMDRINRLTSNKDFMSWWNSDESPSIINVFLDAEGPFGDTYHLDSENSGPHGHALIYEFIPYLENKYRGTLSPETRFVDGCSTGGWVSLGLQLYYPDHFNGVYSYSPDAIDFENYQLINIYQDENAYVNEFGYDRPVMRGTDGEPMLDMKSFVQLENVLSPSNTYVQSGSQFGAHAALYSPKGEDGLPMPLFDPLTGKIDSSIAEHWKKYDFKYYVKSNWSELGPKLHDKIYIWMGDMDHFYLNPATRAFARFLKQTDQPKSNAVIEFSPMEGHCSQYSYRMVLEMFQERLNDLN